MVQTSVTNLTSGSCLSIGMKLKRKENDSNVAASKTKRLIVGIKPVVNG